ncbi:sigma-54 dependent transcriptional regulator [Phreatobacter sp.]|uniref:sigma-54 dependent transcriptional regulator n=1 Tax=Phreatobacter sp. TaxID=1966341 RepID=UPI0022CA2BA2|nr:sigma-54 dependent transcriptional regulator [Phreatobacter sp.]MCZ8313341.1 sigma-54 dependent transcriptional regulator [Phreatobacter sp.]
MIESEPAARRTACKALATIAACDEAASLDEGLAALDHRDPDLLVLGLDGAGGTPEEAIDLIRFTGYEGPILATSARLSLGLAVNTMRAGASDVAAVPLSPAEWVRRAERLMADERPAVKPVAREAGSLADFEGFIGSSPAMRELYEHIRRVAPSKAPVFVTGESGTGKEVTAQAIHGRSGRLRDRFVAINCGAIPKDLMESEIFGHVKGAFTGATEDRPGAAELADGGTLFLDEICEMDLALQTKLLRFIQTGEVRRVGDTKLRKVDVRFVCATNRDPLADVTAGRFREDLYYRLCVLPLHLPPLRKRGDDVVALAEAFLARFSAEEGRHFRGFDMAALAIVSGFAWPGNVRQLQNVIRRLVVMHDGDRVTAAMLPLALAHGSQPVAAAPAVVAPAQTLLAPTQIEPFWVQEKRIIEDALAAFDGNLSRAAAALEISPSTIYRKREAWAREGLAATG